jgi:hypothetical protein
MVDYDLSCNHSYSRKSDLRYGHLRHYPRKQPVQICRNLDPDRILSSIHRNLGNHRINSISCQVIIVHAGKGLGIGPGIEYPRLVGNHSASRGKAFVVY